MDRRGSVQQFLITWAAWLVAAIGIIAAVAGGLAWQRELDATIATRLTGYSAEAAATLEGRTAGIEQLAAGMRAYLVDSPGVDADAYREFLRNVSGQRSVGEKFAGLRALSFIAPSRSGPRQDLVEPRVIDAAQAVAALEGMALADALVTSRDIGTPILATDIEVPGAPALRYALAIPVYRLSNALQPTATVAERRRDLQGWVVAWIDVDEFLTGASPRLRDAAALQLVSVPLVRGAEPSATTPAGVVLEPDAARRSVLVNVRGGTIGLRVVAREGILSPFEARQPLVTTLLGLLAVAAATVLVQALASSRDRALVLVADRTAELREANGDLQRSNRELAEFAGVVSHDLKAPLATSMAYLSSLERHENLTERGTTFVEKAVRASNRMRDLIDELLVYARASEDMQLDGAVDLDVLVHEVREDLTGAIDARGATLEIADLPTVPGDPRKLQQLFQNLVGNALKFVPDERAPHVRVHAVREGERWRIAVGDNGIGIPAEERAEVFAAFRRATGVADYAGTGLGLAICAKIVLAHGGEIHASEDALLGGASIEFTLPSLPGRAVPSG